MIASKSHRKGHVLRSRKSRTNVLRRAIAPTIDLLEARMMLSAGVDLQITATPGLQIHAGQNDFFHFTVTNNGSDAPARSWVLSDVYFSDSPARDGTEQLVSTSMTYVPEAAETSLDSGAYAWIPAGATPGTHYLLVDLNSDQAVPEADYSNNSYAVPVTVVESKVDLAVTSASAPADVKLSTGIDVSWTVSNQGTEPTFSGSWGDTIYYSPTGKLDGSQTTLASSDWGFGQWNRGTLDVGSSYSDATTVVLPGSIPTGPGHLLVVTNSDQQFGETSDANNVFDLPIVVSKPDVDLQVSSATAPPSAKVGDAVDLAWTVTNGGTAATESSWYDSVYLSDQPTWDWRAEYLGAVSSPEPLAGGASYAQPLATTVTIPGYAYTGNVYLLFVANDGGQQAESNADNNVLAVPFEVIPPDVDLQVSDASLSLAEGKAGGAIQGSWTVTNAGSEATTQGWYDAVYFSTDGNLDDRDIVLANQWHSGSGLAGGSSYAVTDATVNLPGSLPLGDGYLLFVTDAYRYQPETDDTNNAHAVPIRIVPPDVDLQVSSATAPSSVEIGKPLTYSWSVTNAGTDFAGQGWTDYVYLSDDDKLDAADTCIAGWWNPSLAAGGTYSHDDVTWDVPRSATAGKHYLLFVTDSGGRQSETNEGNNVQAEEITFIAPDVDLKAENLSVSTGSALPGQSVKLSYTVTNYGTQSTSGGYLVDGFYLSDDATFDAGDQWIGGYGHGDLAGGASYAMTDCQISIPRSASAGAKYLLVVADAYKNEPETDESNNVAAMPITIEPVLTDLALTDATLPVTDLAISLPFDISWTVVNQGTAPTYEYWVDAVYYSTDSTYSPDDIYVSGVYGNSGNVLNAGDTYTAGLSSCHLSSAVSPGAGYLIVVVDAWGNQGESDQNDDQNNTLALPITVRRADIDLELTDATTPPVISPGKDTSVSWSGRNNGGESIPAGWYDSVYFSTDTVLDTGDRYLGSGWLGFSTGYPLGAGESYNSQAWFTVPDDLANQSGYLIIAADNGRNSWDTNQLAETNEDNNLIVRPIDVRRSADWTIIVADAPAEAAATTTISVSWTDKNIGNASTTQDSWYDGVYWSDSPWLDGTETLLGTVSTSGTADPGSQFDQNLDVQIPANATEGQHYLLFVVNVNVNGQESEGDDTNNVYAYSINVVPPDVDLQVTEASVSPSAAKPGQTVTASWTVTNAGLASATQGWWDRVYFSTDDQLGWDDTQLAEVWHDNSTPLAGGAWYTVSGQTLNLSSLPVGDGYLLFVTDDGQAQPETDETNNVRAVPLTILAPDVDLTVGAASSSEASLLPRQNTNLSFTVTNTGTDRTTAGSWYERVYLSDDTTLDGSDLFVAEQQSQGDLSGGESYTVSDWSIGIPVNAGAGAKYLLVVSDIYNNQPETDETNNVAVVPITIEPVLVDLAVTDFAAATTDLRISLPVDISWTVQNQGTGPTYQYWFDYVFYSTDATYSNDDVYLGAAYRSADSPLNPGESYTITDGYTVPNGVGPGSGYLIVVANPWLTQPESDQGTDANNIRVIPVTVRAPDIDIELTDAQMPATIVPGVDVTLQWTGRNNGSETIDRDWVDTVYFSTDAVLDSGDRALTSVWASWGATGWPVGPGGSYTRSLTFTLPDDLAKQHGYLIVAADDWNLVYETNEGNNTIARPVDVVDPYVDWTIITADAPTTVAPGTTVWASWTDKNIGNTSTKQDSWYDAVYWSDSPTLDGSETLLARDFVWGSAGPDCQFGHGLEVQIPANATDGQHYLLFVVNVDVNGKEVESDDTNNVYAYSVNVLVPRVDLSLGNTTSPAQATIGQSVDLSWDVTNIGNDAAQSDSGVWWDRVYLSADATLDEGDTLLFNQYHSGVLNPGDQYSVQGSAQIPSSFASGSIPQYIIFVTDSYNSVGDADRTNNVVVLPFTLKYSDLTVRNATATPVPNMVGQSFNIAFDVLNQGNMDATGSYEDYSQTILWHDRVYLSRDMTVDDSDIALTLSDAANLPLAPGASYHFSSSVQVPGNLAPGTWYLLLQTDSQNQELELNEDNNVSAIALTISAPDLAIGSLSAPSSAISGNTVDLSWTVTNLSSTIPALAWWHDQVFLSPSPTLGADAVSVWYYYASPLNPGTSYTGSMHWALPSVAAGNYYLIFNTNVNGDQSETDFTNNIAVSPIQIVAPDLQVTAASGPATIQPGQNISVSWTVTNTGSYRALKTWYDSVYLADSADPATATALSTRVYKYYSSGLNAGVGYSTSTTLSIPSSVTSGTKYLIFKTDAYGAQGETDETNNYRVVPIQIAVTDLIVDSASAPDTAVVGGQITVSWTDKNQGNVAATAPWYDSVVYSQNAVYGDSDDQVIATTQITSSLAGGASFATPRQITIQLYQSHPAGAGHLFFVVDRYNAVTEGNEANNVLMKDITMLAPDLQVTDATAPTSAIVSGKIDLTWTVTNQGDVTALGSWSDSVYLSKTPDLSGTHIQVGSDTGHSNSSPLDGGQSYTVGQRFSVPVVTAGDWYLVFAADSGRYLSETDETNNMVALPIKIGAPDLELSDATAPSSVTVGDAMTVGWKVSNVGDSQAPAAWYDSVVLASNPTPGAGDVWLMDTYAGSDSPLAAGAFYARSQQVVVPLSAVGKKYILFIADHSTTQGETDETNNIVALPIAINAPDLTVTGGSAPAAATLGDPIDLQWTVKNVGGVAARATWDDYVYLSSTTSVSGAMFVGTASSGGSTLEADSSYTHTLHLNLPTTSPGNRYIIFVANGNGYQGETNKTNNSFAIPITISAPDLVPSNLQATATAVPGQQITVSWDVKNQGTVPANLSWYDGVYLRNASGSEWSMTASGAVTVPLAPDGTYSNSVSVTVPNVTAGQYSIVLRVDPYLYQGETNENNNQISIPIQIVTPDLRLSAATGPSTAPAGSTITVGWTVANIGTTSASSNWTDAVYLGRSSTPSSDDILLTSLSANDQSPLGAGQSYPRTNLSVVIPGNASGARYLIFRTDIYSAQAEVSETNNYYSIPINVTVPNLTITDANSPTSAALGDTVHLSWSVKNNGTATALANWVDSVYVSDTPDLSGRYRKLTDVAATPPLAPDGTYTLLADVPLVDFAPGDRYLVFVTDSTLQQGESDETDNLVARPIHVDAPDLVVTGATAPAAAVVGQPITISWTVANQSVFAAPGPWSDGVYLSLDGTLSDDDKFVTFVSAATHAPLAGNAGYSVPAFSVTLPSTVGMGQRYLLFRADMSQQQSETSENNNILAVPIFVGAPDLQVSSLGISPAGTPKSGDSLTVDWSLTNTGNLSVISAFHERVLVQNIESGLTLVDQVVTYDPAVAGNGSIGAGESRNRSLLIRLPDGPAGAGNLRITVTTDSHAEVYEYNDAGTAESNNDRRLDFIAAVAPYPDLVVQGVRSDPATGIQSSDLLTIHWQILNSGNAPTSGNWRDTVVIRNLDTGKIVSSNDVDYIESASGNGPILAGETRDRSLAVRLPDGLDGTGNFAIEITTDSGSAVFEYRSDGTAESNNQTTLAFTSALAPYGDLVVSDVMAPQAALSGTLVPITWTVTNRGHAPIQGSWQERVYLSDDNVVGGDRLFGTFSFTGTLAVGQSYTRTQEIELPIDYSGDRYVVVATNADHGVWEEDFSNDSAIGAAVMPIRLAPYPNLQVTSITAPVSPLSGQTTDVQWTVTNNGTSSTGMTGWYDRVYLSRDSVVDVTDTQIGNVLNPSYLEAAQGYVSHVTFKVPDDADGQYYILVVSDASNSVYEYSYENDNTTAAAFVVRPTPPADLQVTAVTAPSKVGSGDKLTVSWSVANAGSGPTNASSWYDHLWMGTGTTHGPGDRDMGTVLHAGALAAGGSYDASMTVTIPVDASGDYHFFIETDTSGQVYERSAETNNLGATVAPTTVYPQVADIEVDRVAAPASGVAGRPVTIGYTMTNYGTGTTNVPGWNDWIYLSKTPTLGDDAILLGSHQHYGMLAVDASATEQASVTLPLGYTGDYYVFVVADGGNWLYELSRTNNTQYDATPIHITYSPPDLQVDTTSAPNQADAGGAIRVNWTVSNQGDGDTLVKSWSDVVYLATGPLPGPDDIQIGQFTHTGLLNGGESYSQSQLVQIPWISGVYNLYVRTNSGYPVYEQGPARNNDLGGMLPLTVSLKTADLQVTQVTAGTTAVTGSSLSVTWRVDNLGAATTDQSFWTDQIMLVPAQAGLSPVGLGSVDHSGALAASGSYQVTRSISIPAGTAPGSYYVKVLTDAENAVHEIPSDSNNAMASVSATFISSAPRADLVVASAAAPVQAYAGQKATVSWTVRNDGDDLVNRTFYDSVYLSRDQVLDTRTDLNVGYSSFSGTLKTGESYSRTLDIYVPQTLNGPFYVFFVTDSGDAIAEQGPTENNTAFSAQPMMVTLLPPTDLVAGTLQIPASASPGQNLSITYTVENNSPVDAIGNWTDALYASTDDTWDIGDTLIGRLDRGGPLVAGGSYTATWSGPLPGILPGNYKVILRTNVRNQIREATLANNISASIDSAAVDATALVLDAPTTGSLSTGQAAYYRLEAPEGQTLELTFDSESTSASNELYVRYGQMPTRGVFDYAYSVPNTADQRIVIPTTRGGTYYILAYGNYAPSLNGKAPTYQLTAHVKPFGIESIDQTSVGNAGSATIGITGSLFQDGMRCDLIGAGGQVIPAYGVDLVDATSVYATFDLTGRPVGTYDVRLTTADGAVTTETGALKVHAGTGSKLQSGLVMAGSIRVGRPLTFQVEYANVGDSDMPSPLLHLTGPANLPIGLAVDRTDGTGDLLLLGYSPTGPAGILRPGQREHITLFCPAYVNGKLVLADGAYDFGLSAIAADGTNQTPQLIDWDAFGDASRAPFVSDSQQWNALWTVFAAQVGGSWDQLIGQLAAKLDAQPKVGGVPNVVVGSLLQDMLAQAGSVGGGLTDHMPPSILTHIPVASSNGVSSVDLVFSKSIAAASFTAADLTLTGPSGGSIAVLGVTSLSDRLFRVTFAPQTAPGQYNLTVGPDITDSLGYQIDQDGDGKPGESIDDQYHASFRVDATGQLASQLFVTASTPAGSRDQREGVDNAIISFSEPILARTFTINDVTITGPNGAIAPTSIQQLSSSIFRVNFPHQEALGNYSITIGPAISDLSGIVMNQNGDGTAGQAVDAYTATFAIADIQGPSVVSYTPNSWEGKPVDAIDLVFSEPVDPATFTVSDVAITGPNGAITPLSVARIDAVTFRVTFATQYDGSDYSFTVGPNIRDLSGNRMDQNLDDINGAATDAFTGTFHILPGVSLLKPAGSGSMTPLTDPAEVRDEIAISGRIIYGGTLATYFPNGSQASVILMKQVGARDAHPGIAAGGDPADVLVSEVNRKTDSMLLDAKGEFVFDHDEDGQPIYNVEDYVAVKYYVAVLAKTHDAFVIDEDDWHHGPAPDLIRKPWFTLQNPDPAGRPKGISDATANWGRIHNAPNVAPAIVAAASGAEPKFQNIDVGSITVSDHLFGMPEWVRTGAQWVRSNTGTDARSPIALVYPYTLWDGHSADNAAHYGGNDDFIYMGANAADTPGIVLHEYGHSLQFAANGYKDFPYGGIDPVTHKPDSGNYGVIAESQYLFTAFSEAWAFYVAAKILQYDNVAGLGGGILGKVDYNRAGQFMVHNNFWMGWDAYFDTGREGDDDVMNSSNLAGAFRQGGNPDANSGDKVCGAIESILWQMTDSLGNTPTGLNDLMGVWQGMLQAASTSSLQDFYNGFLNDTSTHRSDPLLQRMVNAIFIDNGVPITDDPETKDHPYDFGILSGPVSLDGLIMAKPEVGGADTFTFSAPKTSDDPNEVYSIAIKVNFDSYYGDLDLVAGLGAWVPGLTPVISDVNYGGDDASVTFSNLHTNQQYDFSFSVFGHGAYYPDGWLRHGGDMNPNYKVSIEPTVPSVTAPKKTYVPPTPTTPTTTTTLHVVTPRDPNDILGPQGFGDSHWVTASQKLPYTIEFENEDTASAPARDVLVTQQLDANLDWRSFRVGDFGWGDYHFDVPENTTFYSTRLDLRDTLGLYVDVSAGVDLGTGQAFWEIKAIDPATGDVPEDPFIGFLPPNIADHVGEGFVSYTIKARRSLAPASLVAAQARVFFDNNAPIDTPVVFNTLDSELPASTVAALPAFTLGNDFTVSWSGADPASGSGLAAYDVYVSDNGGEYTAWLTGTTLTQASFLGEMGHSYSFFSIASDNAGNVEVAPVAAEASIHVGDIRPQMPSGVTATVASQTQVNLVWTDNSTDETGFKIERATDSGFTQNLTLVTTTAADATSYSDSGLAANTTYYYRVRATNAGSDSGNSSTAGPVMPLLQVSGDQGFAGQNDQIRLARDPADPSILDVFVNGVTPTYSVSFAALGTIVINGLGGDDTLTLDLADGPVIPAGGISYDGGTHGSGDRVIIAGSPADDVVTFAAGQVTIGSGVVTLTGVENRSFKGGAGNDSLTLGAGSYTFASDLGQDTTQLSLVLTDGAQVAFSGIQHLAGLTLAGGSRVTLADGGQSTLVVQALSVDATSSLDLADNAMVVDYSGSNPFATIYSLVASSAASRWGGSGIVSHVAAGGGSQYALGVADNSSLTLASFAGQSVDGTSVLIRFTYSGDANLDGQVDVADLSALAGNWQMAGRQWSQGDADYSGLVDLTDLSLLAGNWQKVLPKPIAAEVVSLTSDAAVAAQPVDAARVAADSPAAAPVPAQTTSPAITSSTAVEASAVAVAPSAELTPVVQPVAAAPVAPVVIGKARKHPARAVVTEHPVPVSQARTASRSAGVFSNRPLPVPAFLGSWPIPSQGARSLLWTEALGVRERGDILVRDAHSGRADGRAGRSPAPMGRPAGRR